VRQTVFVAWTFYSTYVTVDLDRYTFLYYLKEKWGREPGKQSRLFRGRAEGTEMKQRFSSLDVKVRKAFNFTARSATLIPDITQVISRELSAALVDLRVANIYDLSSVGAHFLFLPYTRFLTPKSSFPPSAYFCSSLPNRMSESS